MIWGHFILMAINMRTLWLRKDVHLWLELHSPRNLQILRPLLMFIGCESFCFPATQQKTILSYFDCQHHNRYLSFSFSFVIMSSFSLTYRRLQGFILVELSFIWRLLVLILWFMKAFKELFHKILHICSCLAIIWICQIWKYLKVFCKWISKS